MVSALGSVSILCFISYIGSIQLVNAASGAASLLQVSENLADNVLRMLPPKTLAIKAKSLEDSQGTDPKEEHPECPSPVTHTVNGHKFVRFVSNCTCDCAGGKLGWYKNGTPCFTLGLGYNKEMTSKNGKCYNGVCVLNNIPFGCKGENYSSLRIPKNDSRGNPPVGCAFLCSVLNKEYVFTSEFDYYPVGTACRHVKNPGTYTDKPFPEWANATYVTTTCKQVGNETLCREDGEVPVC